MGYLELMSKPNVSYSIADTELHKLDSLTEREKKVLLMRLGVGVFDRQHTLKEIADIFAVQPSRIRQIECKALRKLRHPSRNCEIIQIEDNRKPSKMFLLSERVKQMERVTAQLARINQELRDRLHKFNEKIARIAEKTSLEFKEMTYHMNCNTVEFSKKIHEIEETLKNKKDNE